MVFSAIFHSCSGTRNSYRPDENLYKKNNQDFNIRSIIYHKNDSVSQLFVSVSNENLMYKRPDTSSWFYARLKVRYVVLKDVRSKQILDSGSVWLYDRQPEKVASRDLKGSLKMKVFMGNACTVDLSVFDLNNKTKNSKFIEADKTSTASRQNFLLKNSDGEVIYNYYLIAGDVVTVSSELNKQNSFRVDHYKRDFPIAFLPNSTREHLPFNYEPDSFFVKQRINNEFKIIIPETGFLHITGNNNKEGLTLFSVDNIFPGIKDETEMIKSTHYIMSTKEFESCLNSPNKKMAIDEFWKDIGGSNERARELLKSYYNRVLQANKLFTDHQSGWQTDRGMIYIVFGAPTNMYKHNWGEQWVYGSETQANSVTFNFKKMLNPFSDNAYILERSEYFKAPWYFAVDHWRQGHIYLDN